MITGMHHAWMLPRGRESRRPNNWISGKTAKYPDLTDRQRHLAMKRTANRQIAAKVRYYKKALDW